MRTSDILLETPPQIVNPTDFGLGDDAANRAFAERLLKRKQETLEDHPGYQLFLTGDMNNGYLALYNKAEKMLGYVIKYKVEHRALLGGTVTQVMLWRDPGMPYVPGITRHVFFDYLLTRWPMVMSDALQTERGREFWLSRLAEASIGPYDIGLVDFGRHQVDWWDRTISAGDWIKQMNAWGTHHRFQNMRCVIKRQ